MICIPRQLMFERSYAGGGDDEREVLTECRWVNVRERGHFEDLGLEGRILKWILLRCRIG
jgi:hypothetical protein